MPPELTRTRRAILHTALRLAAQATLSNVAEAVGISKQAASQQVSVLRERGYLEPGSGRYAPLQLTERARALVGDGGYPLLGDIAAGDPIHAEQNIQEYVSRLDQVIDMKEGDFLLKVRGDSMVGVGIYPGDVVVVRPAETIPNGEIAVVLLPGEGVATLKRLVHQEGVVTLHSENASYPPMTFRADEVRVQGCLVAHIGRAAVRQRRQ